MILAFLIACGAWFLIAGIVTLAEWIKDKRDKRPWWEKAMDPAGPWFPDL